MSTAELNNEDVTASHNEVEHGTEDLKRNVQELRSFLAANQGVREADGEHEKALIFEGYIDTLNRLSVAAGIRNPEPNLKFSI